MSGCSVCRLTSLSCALSADSALIQCSGEGGASKCAAEAYAGDVAG